MVALARMGRDVNPCGKMHISPVGEPGASSEGRGPALYIVRRRCSFSPATVLLQLQEETSMVQMALGLRVGRGCHGVREGWGKLL